MGGSLKSLKSREYKVMLRHPLFKGTEDRRREAAQRCWKELSKLAKSEGVVAKGNPSKPNRGKQRDVLFYDTEDHALYRQRGYILRLRRSTDSGGDWDMTLKFRNRDWVRSANQTFEPRTKGKPKFEEDIKAEPSNGGFEFIPLFSRSADRVARIPAKVDDILSGYKRLAATDLPPRSATLSLVRDFKAREEVFEGMTVEIAAGVTATCAIILWSEMNRNPNDTVAAEFSMAFGLDEKARSPMVVAKAWAFFTKICASNWADADGPTKTSFVYEGRKSRAKPSPKKTAPSPRPSPR